MLTNGEIIKTLIELIPFSSDKYETLVYAKTNNKTYTIEEIRLNEDKEINIKIMER